MVNKMLKIKVKGMHCKSCEVLLKESLEELDGVEEVKVSHISGIVSINLDESKVRKEDIIKKIEKEGYGVE